ncbi:MAG: hypothetical protein JSR31_07555 [Nitrospira sp.]|nr:hypothetical protein [Nitrospira sp.]
MSDYLTNLLTRARHPERMIQPRVSAMFDPGVPATMRGAVSGWEAGEDLYQPAPVNPVVLRSNPSVPQSADALGQDRGEGDLLPRHETVTREQLFMSTADAVRWTASSDAGSAATPNGLSSLDSDQHQVPSRNPPDAQAISLSPIDSTVVSDAPSSARVRLPQERTDSWLRSVAQSTGSSLRIPSEQTKTVEKGERSLLRDESSSESPDISSVVPTTQACEQGLNSGNTQTRRGNVASSQQPVVETRAAQGDGERHQRIPTTVRMSEAAVPEIDKQAVGSNLSDFSLDPSLVASVRTTKGAAPLQHPMSHQPAGDASGTLSSVLDHQELNVTPRMSPKTSNSFLARRRSVAPMTAASVSQVSATDREKPVESVVHVTIGRVEVRAVAPPVRQEKGRKAQSAMSLDDYLKRRGGRSAG